MNLGYRWDGPRDAPVLVLGPALGTTMALWEPQLPHLAAGYRVLRYDQLGHGRSAVPAGPYRIETLGGELAELLDGLGLARVAYCGLSLGAMVGIWLAAHAPDRVSELVLVSASAYRPPASRWQERAAAVRAEGMAVERERLLPVWFTPRFLAEQPATAERYAAELLTVPAEGYAGCCEAIGAMDLRTDLAAITARTLVVTGADDPASPPEHGRAIAAAVTGARYVTLPGAAHLANVEQPAALGTLLTDHLESA